MRIGCCTFLDSLKYDIDTLTAHWWPVCRSLLTFMWSDRSPIAVAKNSLVQSNELQGLAKSLQLNVLDLSHIVNTVHCSSVVGTKAPSQDRVGKEFSKIAFSDSKHVLHSGRVVGSFLRINEKWVRSDPLVHARCIELLCRWGPDFLFDTFYKCEAFNQALAKENEHHLLETVEYCNHWLERKHVPGGAKGLTEGLLRTRTSSNDPELGLISLWLFRIAYLNYLKSRYPHANPALWDVFGKVRAFDAHYPAD